METILVLGVMLSGFTFFMLLITIMIYDRKAGKAYKDLKDQLKSLNEHQHILIAATVEIAKAVIPVKKEEAVLQVQDTKEEAPAKPAKKAIYPKGSPEAKARMAALRESAKKKKEADPEAEAKAAEAKAKQDQIADLEKKIAALKGDQQ